MFDDTLFYNAAGDDPLRVYIHPLDLAIQQRSLGFKCPTPHSHFEDTVTINSTKLKGRNIDKNIFLIPLGIIFQSPSAALNIA